MAEERLRDLSIDEFVGRLASADPVPGGGSASAVVGALGAALVAMVASLSEGRQRYAEYASTHEAAGERGRTLADRFLILADEDARAYARFADALKLPRETGQEKAARTSTLQGAAKAAADVPLRCVDACRELLATAEALAGRSNINASSDLSVASLLGEAAARGAAENVLVNLPSVGDDAFATEARARLERLLADIAALATATRAAVASGRPRPPLGPPAN